jgi:hypothetical protein
MENNNGFSLNYKNNFYQTQANQMNRNLSPNREDKINQQNAYINRENIQIFQNGSYYNNQFPYFQTPKKNLNLGEPDTLLSPLDSNCKNDISNNNNLLTIRKNLLNNINNITPFKSMINNSPYNGMKSENKR